MMSALTLVAPTKGVLPLQNLTNLDNWRALIHQITPVVVTVMTTLAITTEDQAAIWVSLFFAVIDPLLSYRNTTDKLRQIVYGVFGLLQSGGLLAAATMVAPPTVLPVVAALSTVFTSVLGRFYTPTSTVVTKTEVSPQFPNNPWPVD
jgi:hypothetical protein